MSVGCWNHLYDVIKKWKAGIKVNLLWCCMPCLWISCCIRWWRDHSNSVWTKIKHLPWSFQAGTGAKSPLSWHWQEKHWRVNCHKTVHTAQHTVECLATSVRRLTRSSGKAGGLNKDSWRGAQMSAPPLHLLSNPAGPCEEWVNPLKRQTSFPPCKYFLLQSILRQWEHFFLWLKTLFFLCKHKDSKSWGKNISLNNKTEIPALSTLNCPP